MHDSGMKRRLFLIGVFLALVCLTAVLVDSVLWNFSPPVEHTVSSVVSGGVLDRVTVRDDDVLVINTSEGKNYALRLEATERKRAVDMTVYRYDVQKEAFVRFDEKTLHEMALKVRTGLRESRLYPLRSDTTYTNADLSLMWSAMGNSFFFPGEMEYMFLDELASFPRRSVDRKWED